jgi:hypothetical protein
MVNRKVLFGRYHIDIKEELRYEKKLYDEVITQRDWKYLKVSADLFLGHAYEHLLKVHSSRLKVFRDTEWDTKYKMEIFGDTEWDTKYNQFHLNLAVGLELLLKSILLKKGIKINTKQGRTIPLGAIINKENDYLCSIFPRLKQGSLNEIRHTFELINLKRNNIAHRSKRRHDHYAYEHRFSYVLLYTYEEYFYGMNTQLANLLQKSIDRSRVSSGSDFKPLRITPKSLRNRRT